MLKVKTKKTADIYELGALPMKWEEWVTVMHMIGRQIDENRMLEEKVKDEFLAAQYEEKSKRLKIIERKLYKLANK